MAGDSVPVMVDDFDTWYAELRPAMAPALAAWCGDASLAADALDEAFTRAVERWDRVRTLGSPAGWVWRTATNVIRRRERRHALEALLLRRLAAGQVQRAPATAGDDIDLRRALLTLTERQRTAIVLHHIADLSHRDVAEALGVAVGTVAATLHQAGRLLADRLTVADEPRTDPADPTDPPFTASAPVAPHASGDADGLPRTPPDAVTPTTRVVRPDGALP